MAGQDPSFQSPAAASNISNESAIMLSNFWSKVAGEINEMNNTSFKTHELPLARIKKIMKLDEDVKMISAEAPVLFAKAAEIFISELSLRAWVHTEDNKRRTLQRNDIAMAISKFDQFDFLIDIVPREELKPAKRQEDNVRQTSMMADHVQYYFQLAQQATGNMANQAAAQPTAQATTAQTTAPPAAQPGQITTAAFPNQLQVQGQQVIQPSFPLQLGQGAQTVSVAGQPQVIQVQAPAVTQQQQQQPQQQTATTTSLQLQQPNAGSQLQQTTQVFQQVMTPSGEVQNIPIQLTPQQFQAIQLQLQDKQSSQPIVIQSPQSQQPDNTVQFTTQAQPQQQQQQPMFIQQLANGQQVYIQHTGQAGETDGQTDGQDAT